MGDNKWDSFVFILLLVSEGLHAWNVMYFIQGVLENFGGVSSAFEGL